MLEFGGYHSRYEEAVTVTVVKEGDIETGKENETVILTTSSYVNTDFDLFLFVLYLSASSF